MEELARPAGTTPAPCRPAPDPAEQRLLDRASAEESPTREGEPTRWRHWLSGSPREVLGRIVRDDPLGVREQVAARLREQAWLLDADRIELRTLARCARYAPRYQGRPELATWVAEHVSAAIEELLQEESESEHGAESAGDVPAAFVTLARPLGLEPSSMRRACAHFNRLAFEERRAFFDLLILGRALDELARESGVGATQIARRARRALDVVLHGPGALESPAGAAAAPTDHASAPRSTPGSSSLPGSAVADEGAR
jgi:hypothetical protein